ncbi:HSP90 family protein [Leucobacter chromiireducens]|uniref:HSP90 family protein n=1 Tax=Leucobacter chromiireducens subsp. chromiireducens TaxID=660067 RepID=A0ABS1SRN6_9MICO|nr:HSP90 family protein [Leucobacter chromiireducens]MBL3690807.1 HSP90 family protein [Leucobacter chromiireducens subsp. chromiireducens]
MTERFQVDLSGMVDLLSRHLYSGPQVYLRELIQNGVDAVTARREHDAAAPAHIRITAGRDEAGRETLEVVDTGVGLTAQQAAELLATIGRSSKRDADFGLGRAEFIGQFGIGMLAAFMVADRIEVISRSIEPGAPAIRWEGRAEGTFDVAELPAGTETVPVGTRVRLTARADAGHWLSHDTVLALAREYGSLLPFDIAVRAAIDDAGDAWVRVTEPELPWRVEYARTREREQALSAYCERTFGFTPLGAIDLELELAGVSGVAFILPQAVSPGAGQHRVYMKRMLLGPRVDRVLPEWSFFVRAVLDTDTLSPTASREQLHDDEVLLGVREAIGGQLKQWALAELASESQLARAVIRTHHLALRGLALTDPEMLDLIAQILPFETTDGPRTLAELGADGAEIVYTTTTEAYRRVAAVARAQGLIVLNAGYVYDADLLDRLGRRPGWRVRELESADLVHTLGVPSLEREWQVSEAVAHARELLTDDDCDVIVRTFAPEAVPAILLRDSEGEHRRDRDREREASPDLWGGLLDAFAENGPERSRTLVLNDDSAVARRLLAAPRGEVFAAGLRSLYLSAVMLAGEGLRSAESAALAGALGVLLDSALAPVVEPAGGTDSPSAAARPDPTHSPDDPAQEDSP